MFPFSRLIRCTSTKLNSRLLKTSTAYNATAYDADGKTSVTVLNREPGLGILIDAYNEYGFRLNNGAFVAGPMVIFPKTVLQWKVESSQGINENALDLFTVLEPRPDILVIGYGGDKVVKPDLGKLLHSFRVKKRINLEILPTEQAVSTFNFLNAEGRFVAAALIPPFAVSIIDDDIIKSRERYHSIYMTDD